MVRFISEDASQYSGRNVRKFQERSQIYIDIVATGNHNIIYQYGMDNDQRSLKNFIKTFGFPVILNAYRILDFWFLFLLETKMCLLNSLFYYIFKDL